MPGASRSSSSRASAADADPVGDSRSACCAAPRRPCPGRAGRPGSAARGRPGAARRWPATATSGRRRRRRRVPVWRGPAPWSAHSSDDLPEPLRPISAVTSPCDAGRGRRRGRRRPRRSGRRRCGRAGRRRRRAGPAIGAAAAERAPSRPPSWRAERVGQAAGVADRQRQRLPAGQPAELDDRRRHRRSSPAWRPGRPGRDGAVGPDLDRPGRRTARPAPAGARPARTVTPRSWTSRVTAASTSSAAVGSSAEVGSSRTRTRGWAVSTGADRHPLLLAAGQLVERPVAQLGDAEQVERLLDPLAHHVGGDRQLLHAVGQLLLDGVGDEAGQRVLADDPDDVGQLTWWVGARCPGRRRSPGRPASRR